MKRILPAALLAAILPPASALAGEDLLDQIVVVANRTPTRLAETAAAVSVVTADELRDRQAPSVFDALRQQPGISIGGGPRQQGEVPAIRGFSGRQIVVTVDGARRTAVDMLSSPLYFDPSFLRQAETLRGASSAVHGAGGLGGVLALETITADSQLEPGQTLGARAFAQYQSGSDMQRYGGQVYGRSGAFDGLLAVALRDAGPIRQGGGTKLRPADTSTNAWLAKAGAALGSGFRVQASHNQFRLDDFGPNNPQANASFPAMQSHDVDANETVLGLSRAEDTGRFALRGTLYRSRLHRVTAPNPTVTPALAGVDVSVRTTGGSLQSTFGFATGALGHRLTAGVDAYEEQDRAATAGAPNSVNPNGRQTVYSGFALDEIALTPWLSLTPALRWDRYETSIDDGSQPDLDHDRATYKGTVSVHPFAGLIVYASYGEAFRAPTVWELYQNYSLPTGFSNFRPNPGLRPESAEEVDLGLVQATRGLFAADDSLTLRISGFRSHVQDLIALITVGTFRNPFLGTRPILQYQNVSRARRRGVEAELAYVLGRLDLRSGYGRVRSVDRNTGANLFSPPDKLSFGLGVQLGSAARLGLTSSFVWAQDYDTTILRRRAAYDVHDVFLTLTPARWPVRLDLGMSNVFDRRYALYRESTVTPDTYEEGRSARIALSTRY